MDIVWEFGEEPEKLYIFTAVRFCYIQPVTKYLIQNFLKGQVKSHNNLCMLFLSLRKISRTDYIVHGHIYVYSPNRSDLGLNMCLN